MVVVVWVYSEINGLVGLYLMAYKGLLAKKRQIKLIADEARVPESLGMQDCMNAFPCNLGWMKANCDCLSTRYVCT